MPDSHSLSGNIPLRSPLQMQQDALAIWVAGVQAVQGHRLIQNQLQLDGNWLILPEHDLEYDLQKFRRIHVLGGGKAGRSMAYGLEAVLAPLDASCPLSGCLNIPQDIAAQPLPWTAGSFHDLRPSLDFQPQKFPTQRIELHQVRPPGINLATPLAVRQTRQQLSQAAELTQDDLCIVLLSGGGSALLSSPVDPVGLEAKNQVTQYLSAAGIPIDDLNIVRSALSDIKAGGLLRRCSAGQVLTLVVSDVLGDPPQTIASGPTWPDADRESLRNQALKILQRCDPQQALPLAVYKYLQHADTRITQQQTPPHDYVVLGNLAVAVDAAGVEAERRGYSHVMHIQKTLAPPQLPPSAEQEGQHMADMLTSMASRPGPDCLITGGEPVVDLKNATPDSRGGRNQQFVLAAWNHWLKSPQVPEHACLISGGTDGEDGPTAAAGACLSPLQPPQGNNPEHYLAVNDAMNFFLKAGGLIVTGGTGTNVCDLRVGLVDRIQPQPRSTKDGKPGVH